MKTMMRCLVTVLGFITISTQSMAQWVKIVNRDSMLVSVFAVSGKNIFAIDKGHFGVGRGVFISTNNGDSWSGVNNGLPEYSAGMYSINAIIVDGTNIFAGTSDHGVYLSTNHGTNWSAVNYGLGNIKVNALAVSGTYLFAACDSGIYRSTNNGINWTFINPGLSDQHIIESLVASGNYLLASAKRPHYVWGPVLLSTNYGINWTPIDTAEGYIRSFIICPNETGGNNFYYGYSFISDLFPSRGVVRVSSNNGKSWVSLLNQEYGTGVSAISLIPNQKNDKYLFAGLEYYVLENIFSNQKKAVYNNSIILSINHSDKWIPQDSGFSVSPNVKALAVLGTNLFAGTLDGVWRRPLFEMISTSVEQSPAQLPKAFSLSQNYPNPFNPTTTIEYQIPKQSFVALKIFDLLGRDVATLVNEYQSAGSYNYQFSIVNFQLSSGIYFYWLQTESFSEVKKMILMK